jgi:septum formation protein
MSEIGFDFCVMPADIDEKAVRDTDPRRLTLALAEAKADALMPKIEESSILITSDQVVSWNGKILEKPDSAEQARQFLRGYAAQSAETVTAVSVTDTETNQRVSGIDIAKIYFREIPEDVIEQVVAAGQVFDWAGGFDIDDPILSQYIVKIEGERESIVGLPKRLTLELYAKCFFGRVKDLCLPAGKFALFGSAPMGVRGLKRGHDIDILVLPEVFNNLKSRSDWEAKTSQNGSEYLSKAEMEIFQDWKPGDWDAEKLISEAEEIDGLPYVQLGQVLKWKKLSRRDKDLADIEIIKEYLKQQRAE